MCSALGPWRHNHELESNGQSRTNNYCMIGFAWNLYVPQEAVASGRSDDSRQWQTVVEEHVVDGHIAGGRCSTKHLLKARTE